jgi:Rod binding domain-containing protein
MDAVAALARTPAAAAPSAAAAASRAEAEAIAKEFEAMFVAELLQPMFAGLETDGPFGGGSAEAAFRPMLVERYAAAIADAGGVGVADAVLAELLRLQGLEP